MPRRAELADPVARRTDVPALPHRSLKPYEARHLLAVDEPLPWSELEAYVRARFHNPRWTLAPAGYESPTIPAPRLQSDGVPTLQLTRHTTLAGPYRDSDGWSRRVVYDVVAPKERWDDPPVTGGGDKDGLARAFPGGLPNREEERVFSWLIAVARRTAGSVKCDVGNAGLPTNYVEVILSPAPQRNVDRVIYSQTLLPAEQLLALVRGVVPQIELSVEGVEYAGPDPALRRGEFPGLTSEFDEFDLARLHDAVDEVDLAALRDGVALTGYGLLADLGPSGHLAVEVAPEWALPQAVLNYDAVLNQAAPDHEAAPNHEVVLSREAVLNRAAPERRPAQVTNGGSSNRRQVPDPWIAYRVTWYPADVVEANWEFPHSLFLADAAQMRTVTNACAKAIHGAVGGVLLDAGDLPLDGVLDGALVTPSSVETDPLLASLGGASAMARGTVCETPFVDA